MALDRFVGAYVQHEGVRPRPVASPQPATVHTVAVVGRARPALAGLTRFHHRPRAVPYQLAAFVQQEITKTPRANVLAALVQPALMRHASEHSRARRRHRTERTRRGNVAHCAAHALRICLMTYEGVATLWQFSSTLLWLLH